MAPAPTLPVHPPNGPTPASGEPSASTQPRSQKQMTKAERRELQERQRAAKAAAKANAPNGQNNQPKQQPPKSAPPPLSATPRKVGKVPEPSSKPPQTPGAKGQGHMRGQPSMAEVGPPNARSLRIFSHFGLPKPVSVAKGDIHPAILRLALQFSNFKITGANARCIATLTAFKTASTRMSCTRIAVLIIVQVIIPSRPLR